MRWRFEHSAESSASPADVWRRYLDVEHWHEWSRNGVVWSRLDGPFQVGSKGRSKPPGLPAARFRLVEVMPERKFATETRMPGARIVFEHEIEPTEAGVRITHRGSVDGMLGPLYVLFIRRSVERSLPDGVDRLAAMSGE